jgi:hypothetical protein
MNLGHRSKKIFFLFVILIAVGGACAAHAAPVPASGAYISWSTNTYTPPFFDGKKLPTAGSPVTAWVMVFSNGKAIDLSQDTIYWYADSNVLQSGVGDQKISFNAQNTTENITNLQVSVQDPTGNLWNANIQVPVVNPKAAIETNYPGGVVTVSPAIATALPYFFNTSDVSSLVYVWTVNGSSAESSENPQEADITISDSTPSGTNLNIQVSITNSSDGTSANASTNLIYQKL